MFQAATTRRLWIGWSALGVALSSVGLALAGSGVVVDQAPATNARLRVIVDDSQVLDLEASALAELPRIKVTATDHGGIRAEFEGVPLHEILRRAGAPLGEEVRGEAIATYVLVRASDDYQAVFALAELDPAFTDRVVILADRRDGRPMTRPEGPLRMIVPDDKRHARWVRMVETLRVRRVALDPKPSR